VIDSHVHLDANQYADPSGAIKRALEAGVTAMVAPGTGGRSNHRVLALARRFPQTVHAACGFHPERLDLTDADLDEALAMIKAQRGSLCAVGEVGMPWYGEGARRPERVERARGILERFARAAAQADLPMILHAPHESAREALGIVRDAGVRRAVFHWHKSDDATTREILEAGYYVSITPEVAYRARDIRLARMVPLKQMMVETDGPWPYSGPFQRRQTEPAMIVEAVDAIARARGIASERVREITAANARRLFGIDR